MTNSSMTQDDAIQGVFDALRTRPDQVDYISVYGVGPDNDLKIIWSSDAINDVPANTIATYTTTGTEFRTGRLIADESGPT